ncbi:MAG: glycosyltransferase [Clostridia bacterium]|nr:glycosyltransferase [Clostridia bacterium]
MDKKVLFTADTDEHILSFHLPYLKLFKDEGYEVHVATSGSKEIPYADKRFTVPFDVSGLSLTNLNSIKTIKNFKEIIEPQNYEIIHANQTKAGFITRMAASNLRKKGTRVIYTAHGFDFYEGSKSAGSIVSLQLEKMLAKYTDTLITVNEEDYDKALDELDIEDICNIAGMGVDMSKIEAEVTIEEKNSLKQELVIDKDSFVILCVGDLCENKNQGMAIRALSRIAKNYNNIVLLFAGKDRLNGKYHGMASSYDIKNNIRFLGYRNDIEKLMKVSDMLISCSKIEGMPMEIIEAMMCNLPVVATNCRGTRELIDNNSNGFLIEIDDDEKMANAITTILNSKNIIEMFSRTNMENLEKYKLENVLEEMESIYFS